MCFFRSWGHRPLTIQCVAKKFSKDEFYYQFASDPGTPEENTPGISLQTMIKIFNKVRVLFLGAKPRLSKENYYETMISHKFVLSLPGLGYDTYR